MKMKCKSLLFILVLLFSQFSVVFVFVPTVEAQGWLSGWNYRKSHIIDSASGAATNYQVKTKVNYNDDELSASNAPSPSIPTDQFLAENIVYDTATERYWWIFEDRSVSLFVIRMAYATSLNDSWTVEASPVISDVTYNCLSPYVAKFGDYWYIYYSNSSYKDIWVQKSSSVNTGYSMGGTSNPILTRGSALSWENNRILEPYVFLQSGTYYLFYMGENASTLYEKVGYATSSSPTSGFTKYNGNPVLNGDHGWDSGQDKAADPFFFEHDGVYYIGVTACASGKIAWKIGFYTTTDFITFTHYGGNPVLSWGASGSWDADTVLRGAICEFNGILYFPYAGGSGFKCGLTTLEMIVNLNEHCRTDFGDIRFTDDDGTTLLNYWLEEKVDSDYAIFWVEVADDLSAQAQTIYIYYGSPAQTTTSNGDSTFLFFDHFLGSSLDGNKWASTGTVTVADSKVTITDWPNNNIKSNSQFGINRRLVASAKFTSSGGRGVLAFRASTATANTLEFISNFNTANQIDAYQYETRWTYFLNVGATSAYHKYEIRRKSTTNGVYLVDEVQKVAMSTQVPSVDLPVMASFLEMDWMFLAKYVSQEPSHGSWGIEESPSPSEDTTSPTYSNVGTNATSGGQSCTFASYWQDNINLSACFFNHNNTGDWQTSNITVWSNVNETSKWANYTLTLNTTVGMVVGYRFYGNDTSNNWNETGIYTLKISTWLTGWTHRKSHLINYASGAGTLYQKQITVHYGSGTDGDDDVYCNSHCRTDFGDIRFTDDNGTTLLDYWMESKTDGDYAVFWVEVADDLSTQNQTIYIYYGKSDATTTSNGTNTFLSFDDFSDGEYTTNPTWTAESGTWSAADYTLKGTTLVDDWYTVRTPSTNVNCAWRYKFKMGGTGTWHQQYFEFMTATDSYSILIYNEGAAAQIRLYYDTTAGKYLEGDILASFAWIPDTNWHIIEIRRTSAGLMKVFLDGVEKISVTHTTITTSQYIRVGEDNTGTSDSFDEVFIRKYVNQEPSHGSWGIEESPSPSEDTTSPTYSNVGTNATSGGQSCTFASYWQDNINLSACFFNHNNTGDWQTSNITVWSNVNETSKWANYTLTLNTTVGMVVGYRFYGNDTSNNWNETGIYTLKISTWLTGWTHRKSHLINYASGAGTLYQKQITVHYGSGTDGDDDVYCNSHCRTDFGDIRFTDDNGTTLLDYWMESKTDGDYAVFWVEVADDLSTQNQTIYIYYGKSDATTTSNGTNTFLSFDDFSDGEYTTNPTWTAESGTWSAADYTLKGTTLVDDWYTVRTPSTNVNCAWRYKFKMGGTGTWHQQYFEFMTATDSYSILIYNEGAAAQIRLYYDTTAGKYLEGDILASFAWIPDTNWHIIEIRRTSAGLMKVFLDGVEKISVTHTTITTSQYIRVGEDNTGTSDSFDEVFIRKYVNQEPSHGSWGIEETSLPVG
jgi:hypothetical protein